MQSKIFKSAEEFEQFKEMLIQDGELNNMVVFFEDKEPESYPCLAKIKEIESSTLGFHLDEDEEIEEGDIDEEEFLERANWTDGYEYEFTFITKQEIEELLG
jgi:hypothetical protein